MVSLQLGYCEDSSNLGLLRLSEGRYPLLPHLFTFSIKRLSTGLLGGLKSKGGKSFDEGQNVLNFAY